MACTFVKILSTSLCTVIRSWKQHPCSLLVWKHKGPFLLVKKCTCIKGKPPNGGQFLQEPTEGSLGGFAICCPSCPFEHLHLLLASPCAAAGISQHHRDIFWHHLLFPFPVVSLLVIWHSCVFPASPSEAQTSCQSFCASLLGSLPLLLSNCSWIFVPSFDPPVTSLVVHCFSLIFCISEGIKGNQFYLSGVAHELETAYHRWIP